MASLLRRLVAVAALGVGIGVAAGSATAAAAPVAHSAHASSVQTSSVRTALAPRPGIAHASDWWF